MRATFGEEIVETLPRLRAVAARVARDRSLADDLVQETVLRALVHADRFERGTNLSAWLVTILKHSHVDALRRRKRRAEVDADFALAAAAASGGQEAYLDLRALERALAALPRAQREAVMLVGAEGWSYAQAAHKAGCGLGTIKSRTSRARFHLRRRLEGEAAHV